jgi:hypothetical protein
LVCFFLRGEILILSTTRPIKTPVTRLLVQSTKPRPLVAYQTYHNQHRPILRYINQHAPPNRPPLPLDRRTCINTRPRPVPCRRLLASLRRTLLSFSRTQRHRRRTNRSLKGFSSFFSSDLCWGPKASKVAYPSRGSVVVSIDHHHHHATTSSLRCNHRRSTPVRISIKSSQPFEYQSSSEGRTPSTTTRTHTHKWLPQAVLHPQCRTRDQNNPQRPTAARGQVHSHPTLHFESFPFNDWSANKYIRLLHMPTPPQEV